jgi:hypothetical protein
MIGPCGSSPRSAKRYPTKSTSVQSRSESGVSHAPPAGSADPILNLWTAARRDQADVPFGPQLAVGIARGSRLRCATLNREHLYGRRASTQLRGAERLDLQIRAGAYTA